MTSVRAHILNMKAAPTLTFNLLKYLIELLCCYPSCQWTLWSSLWHWLARASFGLSSNRPYRFYGSMTFSKCSTRTFSSTLFSYIRSVFPNMTSSRTHNVGLACWYIPSILGPILSRANFSTCSEHGVLRSCMLSWICCTLPVCLLSLPSTL